MTRTHSNAIPVPFRDDPVASPRVRTPWDARDVIGDTDLTRPTVARAVGVEAYRRHVDAMTSFGVEDGRAQAIALDRAAAREADVAGAVEAVLALYATSDRATQARAIAAELGRRGMVRL